jgi:hypothetical protein
MTPTAYRAALSALGMSASSFAAMLGRPRNTVIAWGDPKRGGPPDDVAKWLERRLAALRRDPPPTASATFENYPVGR